jgi:hypothetical protein
MDGLVEMLGGSALRSARLSWFPDMQNVAWCGSHVLRAYEQTKGSSRIPPEISTRVEAARPKRIRCNRCTTNIQGSSFSPRYIGTCLSRSMKFCPTSQEMVKPYR